MSRAPDFRTDEITNSTPTEVAPSRDEDLLAWSNECRLALEICLYECYRDIRTRHKDCGDSEVLSKPAMRYIDHKVSEATVGREPTFGRAILNAYPESRTLAYNMLNELKGVLIAYHRLLHCLDDKNKMLAVVESTTLQCPNLFNAAMDEKNPPFSHKVSELVQIVSPENCWHCSQIRSIHHRMFEKGHGHLNEIGTVKHFEAEMSKLYARHDVLLKDRFEYLRKYEREYVRQRAHLLPGYNTLVSLVDIHCISNEGISANSIYHCMNLDE